MSLITMVSLGFSFVNAIKISLLNEYFSNSYSNGNFLD